LGQAVIIRNSLYQVASLIGVLAGGILADRWSKINVRGRMYVTAIGFLIADLFSLQWLQQVFMQLQ
jgi:MFS family permease